MSDQPPMVCKVCRRALAHVVIDGEESWTHHDQDSLSGHKPVPVSPAAVSVRGRCDFCNEDTPTWTLPVRSFTAGRDADGKLQGYEGDWSACDECAKLIARNAWTALLKRVRRIWQMRHGMPAPPLKVQGWMVLWGLVRHNVTGPLRPIS